MATLEILNIWKDKIEVRELNYTKSFYLRFVMNDGSDNITFYDSEGTIWDFDSSPFSIKDIKKGDLISLLAKIPAPKK